MSTLSETMDVIMAAAKAANVAMEPLANKALALADALAKKDKHIERLEQLLRMRRTGFALSEWKDQSPGYLTPGSEHYRTSEQLDDMAKLRTWWTESDGESAADYFVWEEDVSLEDGARILELWGFDPYERRCHCAGDCCGHWFSSGVDAVSDRLWVKRSGANI